MDVSVPNETKLARAAFSATVQPPSWYKRDAQWQITVYADTIDELARRMDQVEKELLAKGR